MKVSLSGGNGFLGWHTRVALREGDIEPGLIGLGERFVGDAATAAVTGADRVLHLAGVNRGSEAEVREGNLCFAEQLAEAIRRADAPPALIVFANSVQAGNNTAYGDSKAGAAEILSRAAAGVGARFVDIRLPNLFGEHGQPFYNSVTATFSHLLATGGQPSIQQDRELTLMHAQDAADLLLGVRHLEHQREAEVAVSVSGILERLTEVARTYSSGEIPDISTRFGRDLFNTYRSFAFSQDPVVRLRPHTDERGSFFEIVRSRGGEGQSSFSTTAPGVTRGNHFHRRKVERFTVLSGQAIISLRRLFTDQMVQFEVSGDDPVSIDMPTMWAHNIRNTGNDTLYTHFWANEIFDPEAPDTFSETV